MRVRVTTTVRRVLALSAAEWDEIWLLTQSFYEVTRDHHEARLREHDEIALFRAVGILIGMAAIDVQAVTAMRRSVVVIFTSQALIDEAWRGRNLLQRLGLRIFLRERMRHPLRRIYWMFDTFSYKSYLLLPRNFSEFWPRHDRDMPADEYALFTHLAARRYGPAWNPETGVVTGSGHKRLREGVASVDAASPDPCLRFFVERNPGHARGDLLVCLCPLTLTNWCALGRRALSRALRARATSST